MNRETLNHGGFTLVELMIALLISGVLIAGALRAFVATRISYATVENQVSLEEQAAFALAALEDDLLLAGYWGRHADARLIDMPAGISVRCQGRDVRNWALQLNLPVQYQAAASLPCPSRSRMLPGTDALIVRHVSPAPAEPDARRIQLHTNETNGALFASGNPPPIPLASTFNVAVHGWYLDTSSSDPDMPALRRYTLGRDGQMENQEIMPGVEDLQISLAIDTDNDLQPDRFVADYTGTARVLAVQLRMSLRSATPEAGHADINTGDGYRRVSVERTVWLRNQPPT